MFITFWLLKLPLDEIIIPEIVCLLASNFCKLITWGRKSINSERELNDYTTMQVYLATACVLWLFATLTFN